MVSDLSFQGLGFTNEDQPDQPQGPRDWTPAGDTSSFDHPVTASPGVQMRPGQRAARAIIKGTNDFAGGYRGTAGNDAGAKTDANTPLGSGNGLDELLAQVPLLTPEPLDPGTHIPTPQAPRGPSGPTATDLATAKYAALTPRGFSAPRSGIGQGVNTQMRMQGIAPISGFTGPQVASMNGVSSGQVQKQWGNPVQGPQVSGSSTLGSSAAHIRRTQGIPAPGPGQ